jgi:Zn-finger nucleic acid-binding protein
MPNEQEEEYFAKQEFERRKKALADTQSRDAEAERQRILTLAKGRCPKCASPLVTITFRGVELDKCSGCGGLWFDTGELDRVMAQEGAGFLGGIKRIFG